MKTAPKKSSTIFQPSNAPQRWRIKELMNQAMEPNGVEGLGGSYMELNPEKFAELIIKECADVANQHMEHNEGTDYNVGGKIKQHFGVEEK